MGVWGKGEACVERRASEGRRLLGKRGLRGQLESSEGGCSLSALARRGRGATGEAKHTLLEVIAGEGGERGSTTEKAWER